VWTELLCAGSCGSGDCMIEIFNVNYSYPDGTKALKNITLKVGPHENVALVGANGSGKTTLLLIMVGILKGEGSLSVLGESDLKKVRGRVGLVFQNPDDQLFMPTVFDDVAFGPLNLRLDHVEERVLTALKSVGLSGYEKRSPHHLSFGEKKRVAIATVLSTEPELILMDEPSANLDPRRKRQLLQLLKELPQSKIVATHDLGLASQICERAVLLNSGSIAADGCTDEILSDTQFLKEHGL
jgi:cobalt/nickel transport system ATP-binding protein